MPAANNKVLIGWKEIAAYLGCSRSTAARRLRDGLPVFRAGGNVRAFAADIDRWRERLGKTVDEREEDSVENVEDRSRLVLETIPVWVWETDAQGKFAYSNVASFDMLGYRPEELVGSKPSAFVLYKEDVALFDDTFGEVRAKKAPVRNLRCRFLTRENEIRWFEIDAEPAFDARGKFAGARGVSRDVTALVRAEEKERERLTILSFLSRAATDFVPFGPEGDLFAYAAEGLRELVGDASVALTSYDENADAFTVRAVSGLGAKAGAVFKVFGKDPVGLTIPGTGKVRSSLLEGKLRKSAIPLHELTGGIISKGLTRKLQKVIGFGDIYLMGIVRYGKLLGAASIIPARGTELRNPEFVEAFINQAAVAIQRKYAEEAFRKSEERFRALFEGSPAAVTVLNPAGEIVEVNKATERLTGYAAKELRGKRFADLLTLTPEDISKATARYEALLRGDAGEPHNLEIIRKDGTKRWLRVRNSLLREGETLAGIQVISTDITDRKRALEALEDSEEKFRNLVERANDGIAIVVEGRLAYANPRLSEATGYDAAQMLGEPFAAFIDPTELPNVNEYYQQRMRGEDVPTIYETAVRRADGSKMHVELNVGTFSYQGQTAELVFIRDLTERKKAEDTRERQREAFRIIAEAAVTAKSIRALCRRIVTGLAEALGFEIGSIRLYEPGAKTLERTASYGMTRDEIDSYFPAQPLGDPRYFAAQAASTREPIFVPDVTKHGVAKTLGPRVEELGLTAIISWPILGAEGTLLGVINLASRAPKDIAEEDRAFFETVAGMFATVLERRRAEDEVRKSEAKHRLLLESIGSPVLALDGDMNILYYNDAYAAFVGRPREEIERKNLLALFPSFAETKSYEAYAETLATGTPQQAEDDFSGRHLRTAVYPMPWGILAVAADVTEGKRAEKALRESEEKYRNIFEHSPAGIVVHQEGKVSFLSPAMLRIIGYDSAEEVIGRPIMEFVHPDCRERLAQEIETVFARGGQLGEPSELVIIRKDGSPLSVTSVAQTIAYRGAPAIQAYVLNDSGRKRAEEALRESEERYRVLFEGGNDAIFVFNLSADGKPGPFVEVNNEACRYLGYSAAELHKLTPADLVPPQRRETAAEMIRRLVDERELIFEWIHVRQDGTEVPVEISSHVFEFRGQQTAISIVRDIAERKRAEDALRESEEKYRNLFHGSKDAIFIHDLDGNIFDANEQVSALFGYSPEETVSLRIPDLHPPEALPASRRAFEEIARAGSVTFEVDFKRKDGSVFPAEVSASLFEIGGNKVIQGIVRDITERKRAEEALRESEEKYRATVEQARDGIIIVVDGKLAFVNDYYATMVGYAKDDLIGRSISDTVPPRFREGFAVTYEQAAESGVIPKPVDAVLLTADGREIPVETVPANVTYAGSPAILVVIRDVSERREAEAALVESEEKFRLTFESAKDAIFWAEPETGIILECNKAAETMLEKKREDIVGHHQSELHPPEKAEYYGKMFQQHIEQKRAVGVKAEVITKSGKEIPVEITASLTLVGEKPIIQGIFRDVTERRRAEEALRESEEKYHSLADNVPVGIFRSTAEGGGRLLSVNPALAQMFGYDTPEDMAKTSVVDFYASGEDRKKFIETVRSAGVVANYEVKLKRADGSTFLGSLNARAVRGPDGDIAYIDGVLEDITERKGAEEALRKSEQEIRNAEREKTAILSSMSEHVIYHDKELTMLWVNEAAAASVGLSPEVLVGRHCYEVWHGRDRRCDACPVADALETGGPHEEEVTTPDGRVWFIRGYPIKDEDGNVTNAVEVTLEITERKRAEEALKLALVENEALLEAVPDLMFVIDREGNYVDFKRADADKFALSPETIIGKNVRDTGFSAEDEREILAGLERTLRTGKLSTAHYELDTPRGRGTFEARLVKMNDDEVLAVVREITRPQTPEADL